MERTLFLFLMTICFQSYGQSLTDKIVIGTVDTIYSATLKENRKILVHIPEDLNPTFAKKKYPVLYLLDGETHFHTVVGMMRHMSTSIGNEICPEMIVVGITNVNRIRDLQPFVSEGNEPQMDNFTTFLEKELIPYIDKKYPTAPYRMLVGHSIGGLRVVNTLVYHQELFGAYLAIDPSLGHDIYKWYNKATVEVIKKKYDGKSLYIAMGQTMPKGMDTTAILKDTTGNSRHMQTIMGFSKVLKANPNNGLQFDWKYYPKESHGSLPLIATYDGIHSIFSWFSTQDLSGIFDTNINADSAKRIVTSHFDNVSQKMNYKVHPPQNYVSSLADYLAYKKMGAKALAFYKLNAENYPQSSHALNALEQNRSIDKKHISELVNFDKSADDILTLLRKEKNKGNGSTYNLSEASLNSFGYELMRQQKKEFAYAVFKVNTELYPNSFNVFDSFGECLLEMGKEKESVVAYKKSLELNPNNINAKNIISKYENKKN